MARIIYRDADAKKEWLAHVKNSPPGMVPVLIDGHVPAWGFPSNTGDMLARFNLYPKRHWPQWVKAEAGGS